MTETLLFPTKISLTDDEKSELQTYLSRITFDKLFHFKLELNNNWQPVPVPPNTPDMNTPIARLGQFKRVKLPYADIEIICFLCLRETHPADYLRILLKEQRNEILDYREWLTPSGLAGDFLVKKTNAEQETIYRYTAIKDGNRIFVLMCSVSSKYYNIQIANEFLVAVTTFGLINPSQVPYAERLKLFNYYQPVPVQFSFPRSWVLKPDKSPPDNGTSFTLLNYQNETTVGNIAFCAEPGNEKADIETLLRTYLGELGKNGLELPTYNLRRLKTESFEGLWTVNLAAKQKNVPVDITVMLLLEQKAVFLIALVSPTIDADIEAWAVNRRALNIFLSTFRIGEKEWQFLS